MRGELLNRTECNMLKAVAILMIVCHNFAHCLESIVSENEYSYSLMRTSAMWHSILQPDALLPLNVLSFFGHYGVPVFIFLSGYGLVKKYERPSVARVSRLAFLGSHYKKLLTLMLPGLALYFAVVFITKGEFGTSFTNLAAQVTMVINLLSEPFMRIKPGPYWYFGLTMQLYIIYRLLLYSPATSGHRRWLWPLLFAVVCHVVMMVAARDYMVLVRMRYNFFVAALPFAMGVLVARYDRSVQLSPILWLLVALIACMAVFVMNFRFQLWLLAGVAVVIAAVALVKALPNITHKALAWVGSTSAMIFVVHPIVRTIFINKANATGQYYLFLLIYLAISLLLAVAYKHLLKKVKI